MEINEFIEKFADAIEIDDLSSLSPNTHFRDLEEWSSLGGFILIGAIKESCGKEITAADIRACETIDDLYKLAES